MATHVVASPHGASAPQHVAHSRAQELLVPLGRVLFAMIFLISSLSHFSPETIAYATQQGVPFARFTVPFSGLLALLGALSVMFGYKTRIGATLLIVFLLPVTVMMHRFWATPDPLLAQLQMAMFLKNLSMLGGALLIEYFGAGPFSVDAHHAERVVAAH